LARADAAVGPRDFQAALFLEAPDFEPDGELDFELSFFVDVALSLFFEESEVLELAAVLESSLPLPLSLPLLLPLSPSLSPSLLPFELE
jgi:hypothetical protein